MISEERSTQQSDFPKLEPGNPGIFLKELDHIHVSASTIFILNCLRVQRQKPEPVSTLHLSVFREILIL